MSLSALNAEVINATTPDGHTHGCYNRSPLSVETNVIDGRDIGYDLAALEFRIVQHVAMMPHRMSRDCRYDLRLLDKACKGCTWATPPTPPASTAPAA